MKMENDEWPSKIVYSNDAFYHWIDDWNNDNLYGLKNQLTQFEFSDNSTLYVFWMKEVALKTNWRVFLSNWINFLYEDEGCILVFPEINKAFVFSNGRAWLGERSAPKT